MVMDARIRTLAGLLHVTHTLSHTCYGFAADPWEIINSKRGEWSVREKQTHLRAVDTSGWLRIGLGGDTPSTQLLVSYAEVVGMAARDGQGDSREGRHGGSYYNPLRWEAVCGQGLVGWDPLRSMGGASSSQMHQGGGFVWPHLFPGDSSRSSAHGLGGNMIASGVQQSNASPISSDATKQMVEAANSGSSKSLKCYRCELPGHGVKDCKTIILCDICCSDAHLRSKCVLPYQPKPTAHFIGYAPDGLQVFVDSFPTKTSMNTNETTAIVNVHSGEVNAEQLAASFSKMYQCGWEWSAKVFGPQGFLMKFPSDEMILKVSQRHIFELIGVKAEVYVSKWYPHNIANFELTTVWVWASGVPPELQNYPGFCKVGSLIGSVWEVDMVTYRKTSIVRIKVRVLDHEKIPKSAWLIVEPSAHKISFQLEQPKKSGTMMRNIPIMRNSYEEISNSGISAIKDTKMQKDTKSQDVRAPRKKDNNRKERKKGNTKNSKYGDDMVLSSKAEIDAQIPNDGGNGVSFQVLVINQPSSDKVNQKFAKDAGMMDKVEHIDADNDTLSTQGPNHFARGCGMNTQDISEVNAIDYPVGSPKHVRPITNQEVHIGNQKIPKPAYADVVKSGHKAKGVSNDLVKKVRGRKQVVIDEGTKCKGNMNPDADIYTLGKAMEIAKFRNKKAGKGRSKKA
ncbi:uncharacterized protein LOC104581324 isoform X2 [Brachypodium distachyon]|uniref:uncharacterized protein LOC104581324 isoform X2 n=1 Tax=Brachypodium distachyon TaxID=15368 RepID=UPI00052FFE13|nr:uncharacterized protein LOC104581324 isoform X2 [Brachypodium distachyon]|eukprot:XP_024312315.1 uncharacterized protein LOC104581324 isoform X2 [Brachypodium distachyon]